MAVIQAGGVLGARITEGKAVGSAAAPKKLWVQGAGSS